MNFSNMDILLVDDNSINLKVLHDSLVGLGCRIYIASGAEDALSVLDNVIPSLIILDIMMPVIDGFELCRLIREQVKLENIPIIFITALNDVENEAKALSLGAADFITKPINPMLVKARVTNQLKLKYFHESLENEVSNKNEQFFSLIENAPDAILMMNYEIGKIIISNKAAEDLFGFSSQELLDLGFIELSPRKQSDGRDSLVAYNDFLHRALKGEISSFEWNHRNKTGDIIPCEVRLMSLPGDESLVRASIIDISQRKIRENELEKAHSYINNIMNSMPFMLIGLDEELNITHWNTKSEEHTGLSYKNTLGRMISDVLPSMQLELDLIKESIKNQVVKKSNKRTRVTVNGSVIENITIFPVSDIDSKGAVVIIDDITSQVKLQNMVVQSERVSSVGNLASGVVHEITNPLAGIIQNGQSLINRLTGDLPANRKTADSLGIDLKLLSKYLDERKIIQMIESIRSSGIKASHIIKNLNNFTKKDIGNMAYNSIEPIIDQGLQLTKSDYDISTDYDFKKISVIKNIDKNLPMILCEPNKLIQAFLYILRFAASNIQSILEEAVITISASIEGKSLVIVIRDNGAPVAENDRLKLLQPYFKTHDSEKDDSLSLSLSNFIISDIHGGNFDVNSHEDGNEVIIQLPIKNSNSK